MTDSMLTTIDNPFNPFTHYEDWYAWDVAKGYNSCSYLARIAKAPSTLSQTDESLAIERAIDEIVKLNLSGVHRKVTKESFE